MQIPHVFQGRRCFGCVFIFQNVAVLFDVSIVSDCVLKNKCTIIALSVAVLISQQLNIETSNIKLFPVRNLL